MDIAFKDLQYLITVVADDLLNDDFSNLEDSFHLDDSDDSDKDSIFHHDVSEEIYDKVVLLKDLLNELHRHRPLPF